MPTNYEPLVLTIEPAYVGSAVSPTVDITETSDDVTVTITDFRGEHSYTVEKTDGAIADAEAAAANANAAATNADTKGQQAVDIATTAANNANAKAELADAAASNANTKAALANSKAALADTAAANADSKAAAANTAANTANTSASNADAKATAAQNAANAANSAASAANTAASNADAKAALADTAATNADNKATLADTAATNANTKAGLAGEAATAANTAAAAADAAREAIQDDLGAKADKDGHYQQLTAGFADAVAGGTTEVVQFSQRTSEHDGMASIQSLRGNTIVDNDELLSVNINGIQSAGVTREIPASTYFPNGLRSAGTAYDELDFARHKAVTRIGSVDLGTLNWAYASNQFRVKFTNAVRPTTQLVVSNIICASYTTTTFSNGGIGAIDKSIARYYSSVDGLNVRDDSFNGDAAAFKAAMSGVMLYYEIADPSDDTVPKPIETDLPENLQATYPVEIGGTESIVIPAGEQSAPPMMVIVYGYTADGVRDETQSIVAPVEHGVASSNYAVGAYLVMGGTLYRVTTAIATGESINPGTNCTATTVMAEIVRLTA